MSDIDLRNTTEELTDISARLARVEDRLDDVIALIVDSHLDTWRARFDSLAVQARLGQMDARDRVMELVGEGRQVLDSATSWLADRGGADRAVEDILDGVKEAVADIRESYRSALDSMD
ncbi:MAG: hypothetical protein OEU32_14670 [Acidimicrobiia bacterium]|nr:hypothetical protein [Acidimicrobiia bacterium]